MMTKTAGGPGPISPNDYNGRRNRTPPWLMAGVALSVLAHAGVGVWLYLQRFEAPVVATPPETDPIIVEMLDLPRPKPPEPVVTQVPPAPTPPLNRTPPPTQDTDVLSVPTPDVTRLATGPVVAFRDDPAPPTEGPVTSRPVEPAPHVASPVIRNPAWLAKPSGEQLMNAYPERALERGVGGVATLSCLVRADGGVTTCSVTNETPNGHGFGRAALGLSRWFRISPRTVDGQAAAGSRVSMDIRFNPPAD